jgi:hypothetical protein
MPVDGNFQCNTTCSIPKRKCYTLDIKLPENQNYQTKKEKMVHEKPWWEDPAGLFSNDNWKLFFPNPDGPIVPAYNAVLRFSIYAGFLLFIATRNIAYIAAIPFIMLTTFLLYKAAPPGEHMTTMRDAIRHISCTKPTPANPYMNVMIHDISDNPERASACRLNKPDIGATADAHLFSTMDLGEEMNYNFLRRSFVTMPNTSVVPGDPIALAKWNYQGATQHKATFFERPPAPAGTYL